MGASCQVSSPWPRLPLGVLALALASVVRTWSRPICMLSRARGFSSTRTAGLAPPPTVTWPTPSTCASFWASIESAASYISVTSLLSEVSARIMMGASAGLTLR